MHIPASYTRPETAEQPGPPVSQSTRGSSSQWNSRIVAPHQICLPQRT